MLHVLLINKSSQPANVDLRLAARGPAEVEQLLAPSAAARSDVTLDGQQLGPDGTWDGRPTNQKIAYRRHGYALTIPPTSATLVMARLRP